MAEKTNTFKIYDDSIGEVEIADSVVAVIGGLAALDADGVASLRGGITSDMITKTGMKKLARGINVSVSGGEVTANVSFELEYGSNLVDVSENVQTMVKNAIENMTGLAVTSVNINIFGVNVE